MQTRQIGVKPSGVQKVVVPDSMVATGQIYLTRYSVLLIIPKTYMLPIDNCSPRSNAVTSPARFCKAPVPSRQVRRIAPWGPTDRRTYQPDSRQAPSSMGLYGLDGPTYQSISQVTKPPARCLQ